MKKYLLVPFLLSFHFTYAGTGGAKDEILFVLAIIAVLLFIFAFLYSFDLIRKIFKEFKEKKIAHLTDSVHSENIN